MKRFALVMLAGMALLVSTGSIAGTGSEESRTRSREEAERIKANLFAAVPGAREAARKGEGYAFFHDVGAGPAGRRKGFAAAMRTRQEVYMRFEEVPAVGTGVSEPRDIVFLFDERDALSRFVVKGEVLGGETPASAGPSPYPQAQQVAPHVWAYQLRGKTLLRGPLPKVRYFRDTTLN